MLGKIVFDGVDPGFYDPDTENLVEQVSCKEVQTFGTGRYKVLMVDCGMKNNIIRCLLKHDVTVTLVPWNYDFRGADYDGLFVSNGPGNPALLLPVIEHLKYALKEDRPIMGICLGHQLMALASGAQTYKMKYGHRGHNQPVIVPGTQKCFITSQNHGFAVDPATLPSDWEVMFTNLNDGTNEGIRHRTKPFFSTQFHPEASSGPVDTENLFSVFVDNMAKYKEGKKNG